MVSYAVRLLEEFRSGGRPLKQVFDVELLARYFAICDILETIHGAVPKSVKFYYNPVTARLEPIGYDGHFLGKGYPTLMPELADWGPLGFWGYGTWFEKLFRRDIQADPEFVERYFANLERLSSPEYLDNFLANISEDLNRNLDFLYSDIPVADLLTGHPLTGVTPLFYFSAEKLKGRSRYISARLSSTTGLWGSYAQRGKGDIDISLRNTRKIPLQILKVTIDGESYAPTSERLIIDSMPMKRSPKAPSGYRREFSDYRLVLVDASVNTTKQKPKRGETGTLYFKLPGTQKILSTPLHYWNDVEMSLGTGPLDLASAADIPHAPYLVIDTRQHQIHFKPGLWTIRNSIVVPKGFSLTIPAGVKINLADSAHIISYGKVLILGTKNEPVAITSSDGTGRGLLVIRAAGESILRHVIFSGLRAQDDPRLKVTSIATFYESDVRIENGSFRFNYAEDALNIIRSNFFIIDTEFQGASSDAFDSDFSRGEIVNTVIVDSGNDAIDLSGSQVILRNVRIRGAKDKAISVGEQSTVEARRVTMDNSNIGVAVKDSSDFRGYDLTIQNAKTGIAVFNKKREYGPATGDLWRLELIDVKEPFSVEAPSMLLLNGRVIKPNR